MSLCFNFLKRKNFKTSDLRIYLLQGFFSRSIYFELSLLLNNYVNTYILFIDNIFITKFKNFFFIFFRFRESGLCVCCALLSIHGSWSYYRCLWSIWSPYTNPCVGIMLFVNFWYENALTFTISFGKLPIHVLTFRCLIIHYSRLARPLISQRILEFPRITQLRIRFAIGQ